MKYYDVSVDDAMVVDNEGTIWVYNPDLDSWAYIPDYPEDTWDVREHLPEEYTYTKLDEAAQAVIRRGLKR